MHGSCTPGIASYIRRFGKEIDAGLRCLLPQTNGATSQKALELSELTAVGPLDGCAGGEVLVCAVGRQVLPAAVCLC